MAPRTPRVLVTGLGAVTPLGADLDATLAGLRAGASGLVQTSALDGRERLAGIAREFEARPYFRTTKGLKFSDRKTQLGVAAAAMAMRAAAFPEGEAARAGLAVVFGCALGDLEVDELGNAVAPDAAARAAEDVALFAERALRRLYPLWLLVNLPNMLSAQVAIQLEACGPSYTVMTEGVSGLQAIGEGYELIRDGVVDAAVVGGAESPLTPFCFGCLSQQNPDGEAVPVLGEGAAALVLESDGHARERGAPAIAEITGFAVRAPGREAGGIAVEAAAATTRAMRDSLARERRGRVPLPVRVVAAHPARPGVDLACSELGLEHADETHAALAGRIGDTLGAAGAIHAALALAESGRQPGRAQLSCNVLGRSGLAASLAAIVGDHDRSRSILRTPAGDVET
jgi:3-oxoacyl-[acyl-carrier-protein] synthase II